MKAVVQRVSSAQVSVGTETIGEIGEGLLVLLAVHCADEEEKIDKLADKLVNLRIFEDEEGKMNRSLRDINGEVMVVSQFTLYGDATKGNRPSFLDSARPEKAEPFYEKFIKILSERGIKKVAHGKFGALMAVELVNDGPVTIIIDL